MAYEVSIQQDISDLFHSLYLDVTLTSSTLSAHKMAIWSLIQCPTLVWPLPTVPTSMSLCQQSLPGPFIPISQSTGPFHTTNNISFEAVLCEHPRIRPEVSSCAVPSIYITSFYAFNFQSLVQPVGTYCLQS